MKNKLVIILAFIFLSLLINVGINQAVTNQAPTILPIADQQIQEGDYFYLTVTAEDPNCGNQGSDDYTCPSDTLSFTVDNMPLGGRIAIMNTDGGTEIPNTQRQRRIVWLPLPSQAGQTYTMTVRVTDAAGLEAPPETFSVTVIDRTGPPTLTAPTSRQVFAGEPLVFIFAAQDYDYPAQPIQLSASNLPNGAEFTDYGTGVGLFRWQTTIDQAGLNPSVVFSAHSGSDTVSATVPITVLAAPTYQNISACGNVYSNVRVVAPLVTTTAICLNVKANNIIIDGNNQPIEVQTGSERKAVNIEGGYSGVTVKNVVSNYPIRLYGDTNTRNTIHDVNVGGITNLGGDDLSVLNSTMGTFMSEGLNYDLALRTTFLDNTVISAAASGKAIAEFIGSLKALPSPITNYVIAGNAITGTNTLPPDGGQTVLRIRKSRGNVVFGNTVVSTGTRLGLYIRDQSNDTLYENNTFESESAEAVRIEYGNDNRTTPAGNIFKGNRFISRATLSDRFGSNMGAGYANTFLRNTFWLDTTHQFEVKGAFENIYDHNTFYLGSNFHWTYRHGPPADRYTNNIFSYAFSEFFTEDGEDGFALNRYSGDYNLFFNRLGQVMFSPPEYTTLDNWRQQHAENGSPADVNSLEADPLFVNPAQGDFHLQANSPAHNRASDGSDLGAYEGDQPQSNNQAPILDAISDQSVNEGAVISVPLHATDPNSGDVLSLSWTSGPAISFAELQDNGNGNGTLTFSPNSSHAGQYTVTVRVADNGNPPLQDSEQFTLTVNDAVNHEPTVGDVGDQVVNVGETKTIPITISDADGDGIAAFGDQPDLAFVTVNHVSGNDYNVVIAPNSGQAGIYSNNKIFATDNDDTPATGYSPSFNITVGSVNGKPVFYDTQTSYTLNVGEPVHVVARAQDPDAGDTVNIIPIMFIPRWLSVVNSESGNPALIELEGTPDESAMAHDTLVLNAYDNSEHNSYITITFDVNIVNETPYFYDTQNYYEVPEGGDIQFEAHAKDNNPEDSINLYVPRKPDWVGYFRWNGNPARMALRIRPPEGSGGRQYPIELQAVDNHGASVYFIVTVNVPSSPLKIMSPKAVPGFMRKTIDDVANGITGGLTGLSGLIRDITKLFLLFNF